MSSAARLLLLFPLAACRWNFDARPAPGAADDAVAADSDAEPPPPFVPYWTSGTRMRARLLVPVEGGDPYWNGWRDTTLGMDCRGAIATDGNERCVAQTVRADVHYADAGCTQPLAWVLPATCGSATHAFVKNAMDQWRTFAIGALHTGAVYQNPGCVLSSAPDAGTLHALGAEVAPAQLLAAEYRSVQVGAFERPIQGFPDGAGVEIGSLFTPMGGCIPAAHEIGPSPCFPNVRRTTPIYLDTSCTQPGFYWDRQSYDPTTIPDLLVFDPAACENSYKLYTVTADVTAPTYYRLTTGGCTAFTSGAIAKLYTATQITSTMPNGTIVVGPRRGRLGYLYWVGSDNEPLAVRYWDHDLQTPCIPINATDGKLRCLPEQLRRVSASRDGTCSAAPEQLTPACFPSTPVDGPDYSSCTDTWTVQTLPTLGTTASAYGDTCNTLTLANGFYDPAAPGAAIDPSIYAEMKEVIE